jgi:hypothetical protein
MHKTCPFLHDCAAVLANRAAVLSKRRETFSTAKITPRQRLARERMFMDAAAGHGMSRTAWMDSEEYRRVQEEEGKVVACCAKCLKPWFESQATSPLLTCSKCKFTYYCSVCTAPLTC